MFFFSRFVWDGAFASNSNTNNNNNKIWFDTSLTFSIKHSRRAHTNEHFSKSWSKLVLTLFLGWQKNYGICGATACLQIDKRTICARTLCTRNHSNIHISMCLFLLHLIFFFSLWFARSIGHISDGIFFFFSSSKNRKIKWRNLCAFFLFGIHTNKYRLRNISFGDSFSYKSFANGNKMPK